MRDELLGVDVSNVEGMLKSAFKEFVPIQSYHHSKSDIHIAFEHAVSDLSIIRTRLSESIEQVKEEIAVLDAEYKLLSKQAADLNTKADVKVNRENRSLHLHPDVKEIILGRLATYTNWQYTGLEIGPGDGYWTKHLVAMDPLYLVDIHEEFLSSTHQNFPQAYQHRLRKYKINNGDLSALPEKQFGLIFSWNVFNYFDIDTIRQYLIEAKRLILPGGVIFFSYNNCDNYKSCEMFEGHYMSYTTNLDVTNIALELGFEIIKSMEQPTLVSWMEIKLPGELKTNRAGQTLAKIIDIHPPIGDNNS